MSNNTIDLLTTFREVSKNFVILHEQIQNHNKITEKQDKTLKNQYIILQDQNKKLKNQDKKLKDQDKMIKTLKKTIKDHEEQLSKKEAKILELEESSYDESVYDSSNNFKTTEPFPQRMLSNSVDNNEIDQAIKLDEELTALMSQFKSTP